MKKKYIIPTLQLTKISSETLIAESVGIYRTTTVSDDKGAWVKEDNTSSSSDYNVWDDDWSR